MKQNNLIAAYIFAATLCVSCVDPHKEHNAIAESPAHIGEIYFSQKQAKEVGLELETVTPNEFRNVIKVGGQILPTLGGEQTVVATADGIVSYTDASVAEGSKVRAGQAIVTLSARHLQGGDPLLKTKAEYVAAEKQYTRAKALFANKAISEKEYEQVTLRYETAKVAYMAQASGVTSDGLSVTTPIGGYIKNILVKPGEYVNVGTPLLTVTRNRRLLLRADVPETHFKHLPSIVSANFKPAYEDSVYSMSEFNGRLVSYGRTVEPGVAFLPVTFEFDNIGTLVAGAYTDVYLQSYPKKNVLSVPVSALTEEQGVYYVYVKAPHEQEVYVKREVTVGMDNGKRVEITHGLKAGEIVVKKGAYQIRLASTSTTIPEGHSH